MTSKSSPNSISKFPLFAKEETKNVVKEKNDVKPDEGKEEQSEEKTIISAKEVESFYIFSSIELDIYLNNNYLVILQ